MRRGAPDRSVAFCLLAWVCVGLLGPDGIAAAQSSERHAWQALDGVVAVVGQRSGSARSDVILRSDVELRAQLALAGRTSGAASEPAGREPLPTSLLLATLEQLISEALILREGTRLHAAPPSAAAVARERRQIADSVGGEERLRELCAALSASMAEIDAIAERRAFVAGFLRANLEGATLITDADVEQAYQGGQHPFSDRPLAEVREPLRAWLAAAALQRDVARWVEVLRGRTPVRIVVPFGPDEAR